MPGTGRAPGRVADRTTRSTVPRQPSAMAFPSQKRAGTFEDRSLASLLRLFPEKLDQIANTFLAEKLIAQYS